MVGIKSRSPRSEDLTSQNCLLQARCNLGQSLQIVKNKVQCVSKRKLSIIQKTNFYLARKNAFHLVIDICKH